MVPTLETIISYLTIVAAVAGALFAALWLSLVIWAFRDMRARTRDPFAQLLAALLVAVLPFVGIIIYLILRPPETLAAAYERALEEEALLQEIEERPACPGCSRTVDANWILCPHCHTRLRKACPDCNSLLELQWNLCPFCGNQHIDPYRTDVSTAPVVTIDSLEEADQLSETSRMSANDAGEAEEAPVDLQETSESADTDRE